MTRQEQIAKMAKIVDEMYNVYTTTAEDISEGLYNAGYRKIDDDCAVITKAELKQYKVQAVKEFVEKLKNNCSYSIILELKYITENKIDELSRMID